MCKITLWMRFLIPSFIHNFYDLNFSKVDVAKKEKTNITKRDKVNITKKDEVYTSKRNKSKGMKARGNYVI